MYNPLDMANLLQSFLNRLDSSPTGHVVSSSERDLLSLIIQRMMTEYHKLLDSGEIHYKYMERQNPRFESDWRKLTGQTAKFIRPNRTIRYHDGYNWNEYDLTENDIKNGYIAPHRDFLRVDLFRPEQSDYNYILVSDADMKRLG